MSSSYDSALVDTAMIEDARLLTLPRSVRMMHIEALVWAKLRRTDGFIPAGALASLTDEPDPKQAAKELARVGLWDMTNSGWRIIGFTETQMSAARVAAKREAARERYDRWQQKQSDKRVDSRVTNGAARPPARPPTRVGGRAGGDGDAAGPAEPAAAVMEQVIPQPPMVSRRELARMIRESPPGLSDLHRRVFKRAYGHLYRRGAAA